MKIALITFAMMISHVFFRMALDKYSFEGDGVFLIGWTWRGLEGEIFSLLGTLATWVFWLTIYNEWRKS